MRLQVSCTLPQPPAPGLFLGGAEQPGVKPAPRCIPGRKDIPRGDIPRGDIPNGTFLVGHSRWDIPGRASGALCPSPFPQRLTWDPFPGKKGTCPCSDSDRGHRAVTDRGHRAVTGATVPAPPCPWGGQGSWGGFLSPIPGDSSPNSGRFDSQGMLSPIPSPIPGDPHPNPGGSACGGCGWARSRRAPK